MTIHWHRVKVRSLDFDNHVLIFFSKTFLHRAASEKEEILLFSRIVEIEMPLETLKNFLRNQRS